jgi:3-hydroxyisobutyrate dehydrogenase-like beta-hydroxyacid dehydrogenase
MAEVAVTADLEIAYEVNGPEVGRPTSSAISLRYAKTPGSRGLRRGGEPLVSPVSAPERATQRVGFCGLGRMGWPMATNLLRAGYEVVAWTRSTGKAARWADQSELAGSAETPASVAEGAAVIVVMVVDGDQLREVVLGEAGLVSGTTSDRLLIVMATVGPASIRSLREQLPASWALVDAPVSGGVGRARDGTLTIIAAGPPEDRERAGAVLRAMGSQVEHVGPLGRGQLVKLLNNAVGMANLLTAAQALVAGDALGIDAELLARVLGRGSGASTMLELSAATMLARDRTPRFRLDHMLKDLELCVLETERAGIPFAAAHSARDVLALGVAQGLGDTDFTAVLDVVERLSGHAIGGMTQLEGPGS